MPSKSKELFSTLTFQHGILDAKTSEKVLSYFKTNLKDYNHLYVVRERGATGKNNHIHVYASLVKPKRTDSFSRTMRSFYAGLVTNRYTVKTLVEKDPVYRVGCYMQKEVDNLVLLKHNISPENLRGQYQARKLAATDLLKTKNNRQYTINQLPSVYITYCDQKSLDYSSFVSNFSDMIRDGYITCSQMKNLSLVKDYVFVLKGCDVDDVYLRNKRELKSML